MGPCKPWRVASCNQQDRNETLWFHRFLLLPVRIIVSKHRQSTSLKTAVFQTRLHNCKIFVWAWNANFWRHLLQQLVFKKFYQLGVERIMFFFLGILRGRHFVEFSFARPSWALFLLFFFCALGAKFCYYFAFVYDAGKMPIIGLPTRLS